MLAGDDQAARAEMYELTKEAEKRKYETDCLMSQFQELQKQNESLRSQISTEVDSNWMNRDDVKDQPVEVVSTE
jgi:hypothetical protein